MTAAFHGGHILPCVRARLYFDGSWDTELELVVVDLIV